ncbi:hypothetical protein SLEP1_g44320 [Rubroshorea leprosula]|uniref:Uncharacterized protein n=1 Tax=Rubroshorea leprosula TaxID=152421 RepID=A0AAV5LGZ6_9ROSI|nr:hypothetical protein SLEP1_g44320 [Rubroshorea leprosula]
MTSSSSVVAHKVLSKTACNHLQKKLVKWQVNPPTGFKRQVTDNLQSCLFVGDRGGANADSKMERQRGHHASLWRQLGGRVEVQNLQTH